MDAPAVIGVLALLGAVLWAILVFNGMIRGKNLSREAWSGIDVQLKRRYDLIPNLVETVRGYGRHEQKVFEEVTAARSRSLAVSGVTERGEAETALTRSLRGLFAVVEAYPDLKANQNFLDLQRKLAEIEDDIQLARRYYNGTVRDYDIRVESFPGNLVASACGFRPMPFFEIETATQREAPGVKL